MPWFYLFATLIQFYTYHWQRWVWLMVLVIKYLNMTVYVFIIFSFIANRLFAHNLINQKGLSFLPLCSLFCSWDNKRRHALKILVFMHDTRITSKLTSTLAIWPKWPFSLSLYPKQNIKKIFTKKRIHQQQHEE